MNWEQAIERQRGALASIVASLIAMVGLVDGSAVSRLPFPVHRAVLRILHPAESAVRRLIAVVARGLEGKLPARRPVPAGLRALARKDQVRMSFPLCDPRRPLVPAHRAPGPRTQPRIHVFSDGALVTILGRSPFDPAPQADEAVDASRLCRRLSAIKSALENLPREARRMARLKARRRLLAPEKRRKPIRPGRPPGHRRQSSHEVDEVLKDCHWLAWEAARLDTS